VIAVTAMLTTAQESIEQKESLIEKVLHSHVIIV
jgi:hypothetical protein